MTERSREWIENVSRERIDKETKGVEKTICLSLLLSFLTALRYSTEDMSSQLNSTVKCCSTHKRKIKG